MAAIAAVSSTGQRASGDALESGCEGSCAIFGARSPSAPPREENLRARLHAVESAGSGHIRPRPTGRYRSPGHRAHPLRAREALLEQTPPPARWRPPVSGPMTPACARRRGHRRPGCGTHRAAVRRGAGEVVNDTVRRSTEREHLLLEASSAGIGRRTVNVAPRPRPGLARVHGSPVQAARADGRSGARDRVRSDVRSSRPRPGGRARTRVAESPG